MFAWDDVLNILVSKHFTGSSCPRKLLMDEMCKRSDRDFPGLQALESVVDGILARAKEEKLKPVTLIDSWSVSGAPKKNSAKDRILLYVSMFLTVEWFCFVLGVFFLFFFGVSIQVLFVLYIRHFMFGEWISSCFAAGWIPYLEKNAAPRRRKNMEEWSQKDVYIYIHIHIYIPVFDFHTLHKYIYIYRDIDIDIDFRYRIFVPMPIYRS